MRSVPSAQPAKTRDEPAAEGRGGAAAARASARAYAAPAAAARSRRSAGVGSTLKCGTVAPPSGHRAAAGGGPSASPRLPPPPPPSQSCAWRAAGGGRRAARSHNSDGGRGPSRDDERMPAAGADARPRQPDAAASAALDARAPLSSRAATSSSARSSSARGGDRSGRRGGAAGATEKARAACGAGFSRERVPERARARRGGRVAAGEWPSQRSGAGAVRSFRAGGGDDDAKWVGRCALRAPAHWLPIGIGGDGAGGEAVHALRSDGEPPRAPANASWSSRCCSRQLLVGRGCGGGDAVGAGERFGPWIATHERSWTASRCGKKVRPQCLHGTSGESSAGASSAGASPFVLVCG